MIKKIVMLATAFLCGCASITQIDHVHGKGLVVNKNVLIDEWFTEEIWEKSLQVTGISHSMPEVHVSLHSPTFPVETHADGRVTIHRHYGTYYPRTGEVHVYFGDALDVFKDPVESQAFIYGIMVHEFLHRLYDKKFPVESTAKFDHCKMISSGDLDKILDYVQKRVQSNGAAKEYNLETARNACRR